jgi:hypothetical protein
MEEMRTMTKIKRFLSDIFPFHFLNQFVQKPGDYEASQSQHKKPRKYPPDHGCYTLKVYRFHTFSLPPSRFLNPFRILLDHLRKGPHRTRRKQRVPHSNWSYYCCSLSNPTIYWFRCIFKGRSVCRFVYKRACLY